MYIHLFRSPKLVVQTRIIYENKVKRKTSHCRYPILDHETAYLTDYTAIQRVSLSKFVSTHGLGRLNVIDILLTLRKIKFYRHVHLSDNFLHCTTYLCVRSITLTVA